MRISTRKLRRGAAWGIALLACLPLSTAFSQGRDPAGAEKLYDDGAKLLAGGDWPGACAKFEQSFALDAAPGTLLNLASCAEHDGKLALAWSRLKDARSLNADTKSDKQKKEIESFIANAIKRIEPRLPYLTIRVAGDVPGLVVTRDGQPTAAGVELPVDPGSHVIEASAPGYRTAKKEVSAKEASREIVDLTLEKDTTAPPPPTATAAPTATSAPTAPPPVTPPQPPPGEGGLSPLVIAGIVTGGLGVVTIAISIGTGVAAKSKESDLDALGCTQTSDDALGCPQSVLSQAETLSADGSSLALTSTVTTFVGAALAGTGILLVALGVTSEGDKPDTAAFLPYVGPDGAGLGVRGSF